MGCVGSTSARTPSPPHYHQRAEEHHPTRSPNVGDTGLELVNRNLQSVLNDTDRLVAQIGMSRASIGETLRPVHESAIRLRNRIQSKITGNPWRGSGADEYRRTLESIRADFNAISSADDDSRYFEHSMIFGVGSSMTDGR